MIYSGDERISIFFEKAVESARAIAKERELGEALGLDDEEFNQIEADEIDEESSTRMKIIKHWIRNDESSSLDKLQAVIDKLSG